MKKVISSLFALCLMLSVPSFAANTGKLKPEILKAYLNIQESLANDLITGISSAAASIAKNTQDTKLKSSALALSRDTDLSSARNHFKTLSLVMDQWAKTEKPADVDRVSCPMANASWLQKHGEIQNPYYGKKMQGCGEVQK